MRQTTDGVLRFKWGDLKEETGVIVVPVPQPPKPDPKPTKGNVRGVHGGAGMAAPPRHLWDFWLQELKAMDMAWYKLLDSGDPNDTGATSAFAWAQALRDADIEPIVRFYVNRQFPKGLGDYVFDKIRKYAEVGITLVEIGNEPNLPYEWETGFEQYLSWTDPFFPDKLMTGWLWDAERSLRAGARPGFYALAPTDWGSGRPHPKLSSVRFYEKMLALADSTTSLRNRLIAAFEDGAWLAVHSSPYEFDFNKDPRPPTEPAFDMCLRGYEIPYNLLNTRFGLTPLTLSTEGGVFCMDSSSMSGHERLRSHEGHGLRTRAMYDWVQSWDNGPLQAVCSWLLCNEWDLIGHRDPAWDGDAWYRRGVGGWLWHLPVVDTLKGERHEDLGETSY